ncbi:hypothetical protein V8C40DRAFT_281074 [Trichoderma camerunense]
MVPLSRSGRLYSLSKEQYANLCSQDVLKHVEKPPQYGNPCSQDILEHVEKPPQYEFLIRDNVAEMERISMLCALHLIPLIKIGNDRVAEVGGWSSDLPFDPAKEDSPQIFSLGEGHTSRVVTYTIEEGEGQPFLRPKTKVALKVFRLRPSETELDAIKSQRETLAAILREVKIYTDPNLAKHPNFVRLLFLGIRRTSPFPTLALEFSPHGSLDQVIRASHPKLLVLQMKHVTIDIAIGIHAIHSAGFQHGDLKTDNILLMPHQDAARGVIAKITDFGGVGQDSDQKYSNPTHVTRLWAAPEVMNNDTNIDWKKADIYSFGLVVGSLWTSRCVDFSNLESSCFLSNAIRRMSEDTPNYYQFLKTHHNIHLILLEELSTMEPSLKQEISKFAKPLLQASFEVRPNAEDLLNSLEPFLSDTGRHIMIEKSGGSRDDTEIEQKKDIYKTYIGASLDGIWESIANLISGTRVMTSAFDNLQGPRTGITDMPMQLPDNISSETFLRGLLKQLQCTIPGLKEFIKGEKIEFINTIANGGMYEGLAAVELYKVRGIDPSTKKNKNSISLLESERAIISNIRHAALYGHSISLATYMIIGEHKEGEFPARLFLSLLALSQSSWAAQILSIRWPSYIKIIRKILRNTNFSIRMTAEKKSVYLLDCVSSIFRHLTQATDAQSRLTLEQAFSIGAVADIRSILINERDTPEVRNAIPSLLHRLSTLTDDEAVQLVRLAYDIGASLHALDYVKTSVIREGLYRVHTPFGQVTPLSAAILRGRVKLALEILNLHIEFRESLKFYETFLFSVIYRCNEICRAMLNLNGKNLALLDSHGNHWNPTSKFFDEMLMFGSGFDCISFEVKRERLFFHAEHYSKAYKETVDMLLTEFVRYAPFSQLSRITPSYMLQLDDLDAIISVIKAFEKTDDDVISLLTESFVHTDPNFPLKEKPPLLQCILHNSYRCFEYIIKRFPESISIFDMASACALPSRGKYLRLLLENGANLVSKEVLGLSNATYLELVLLRGDIEAANMIESFCSPWLLQQLLFDSRTRYGSTFLDILAKWTVFRHPQLIHAIEWLLAKKGIQTLSPKGLPFWFFVMGAEHRPCGNEQQLLDRKLLSLLLDEPVLCDAANTTLLDTFTILHFAVIKGHREIVDLLISKKVKITDVVFEQNQGKSCQDYDPKHRNTALDLSLCLYLCGTTPETISRGGRTETLKWLNDLRIISSMLYRHGCKSNFLSALSENEINQLFFEPNFRTVLKKRLYQAQMRVFAGAVFELFSELLSEEQKPESRKRSQKHRDKIASIWAKIEKTWSYQADGESSESISNILSSTDKEKLSPSPNLSRHVNEAVDQSEHASGLSPSQDRAKRSLMHDTFHSKSHLRHPTAEDNIESCEKLPLNFEQSYGIDDLLRQAESLLGKNINDDENEMNPKYFQQISGEDIPFHDKNNGHDDDDEKSELDSLLQQAQNLLDDTRNQKNKCQMDPILSLDNPDSGITDLNIARKNELDEEKHILDNLLQQAQILLESNQCDMSPAESLPNLTKEIPDHNNAKEKEFIKEMGSHSNSRQDQHLPNTIYGHSQDSDINHGPLSQASNSELNEASRENEDSQDYFRHGFTELQKLVYPHREDADDDDFNISLSFVKRKTLDDGFSPGDDCPRLHLCLVESDNPSEIRLLIENGADINLIYNQWSPVSLAVSRGRRKSLEVLLHSGASANSLVDPNTQTTLCHLAARHGYLKVMLLLFQHDADINAKDIYLRTPLMEAIIEQQWPQVMVLTRLDFVDKSLVDNLLDPKLVDLSEF